MLIALWLLFAGSTLLARQDRSLPVWHWSQRYISDLQLRSQQPAWFLATLPLTYSDLKQSAHADSAATSTLLQNYIRRHTDASVRRRDRDAPAFYAAVLIDESAGQLLDSLRSRAVMRFLGAVHFMPGLSFVNMIALDQHLGDDPDYLGKRWRGITAISEQAYAQYSSERVVAKFGRDYIRWGPGYDASLTVSNASLPFDQFSLRLRAGRAQFSYFTSRLNTINLADTSQFGKQDAFISRYLSGGRLDLGFLDKRLQIGLTQVVLYGGAESFEWYFLNPFIFYHGEQLNGQIQHRANTLGAIDVTWQPAAGFRAYGQFMIDDIQIERSLPSDLEPNEIGFLVGAEFADPGGLHGLTAGIEYTRVTNWTYNTQARAEKFLHRNKPIGHFLGNDFDRTLLHARYYVNRIWQLQLLAERRRIGEGRINAPFTMPWLSFPISEGYSEPFPTGIVEEQTILQSGLRWHPKPQSYLELNWRWTRSENTAHAADVSEDMHDIFLRLWFDMSIVRDL